MGAVDAKAALDVRVIGDGRSVELKEHFDDSEPSECYASGSPIPITVLGLDRGEPVERRRNRGRVAKPGQADLPSVLIS